VALSGDGKLVASGSWDHTAILWDAASGQKRRTFPGQIDMFAGVALSGDGKLLWTALGDTTIRLWDTTTGEERCRLVSLDAGKDWLVVTPDGRFDGSPGAWRFVAYREPGTLTVVDDEATRRHFHRPGLLAELCQRKQ
jgi:WD40 repeat protein